MSDIEIAGLEELQLVEAGGFGLVYRAYQPHFERTVAVKVLQTRVTDDQLQHQFRRECAAAGRLTGHPHIVTVFDAGFTGEGRPYLVMEWMSGGSLEDHLRSKGPLGPRAVVTIGVKVADALGAAHADGVLHRDVKPANILISRFGEPELADFGIASLGTATGMSQSMYALTPVHSAPEVLEGAKATPAADIYSLASTLWTLLTGDAPFAGPTDEAVVPMVMRILRSEVPPLDRPDVPPALADVLAEGLAKAPDDRPATAAQFADRLTAALDAPHAAIPPRTSPKAAVAPVRTATPPEPPEPPEPPVQQVPPESPVPKAPPARQVRPVRQVPPESSEQPEAPVAAEVRPGPRDVTEVVDVGGASRRRTSSPRRIWTAAAIGAAVLVLVAGAVLAWRFTQGGDPTEVAAPATTAGSDTWPPSVGSCLGDDDPNPASYDPTPVPCGEPHVSEVANVFLIAETSGTPYPGEAALRSGTYKSPCTPSVYDDYLGVPLSTRPELVATEIQPDARSWEKGKAMFICVLEHRGGAATTGKVSR